jgi:hypothetical protein
MQEQTRVLFAHSWKDRELLLAWLKIFPHEASGHG